eukprot:1185356-Prorocentrum_minimum.AAC.2
MSRPCNARTVNSLVRASSCFAEMLRARAASFLMPCEAATYHNQKRIELKRTGTETESRAFPKSRKTRNRYTSVQVSSL